MKTIRIVTVENGREIKDKEEAERLRREVSAGHMASMIIEQRERRLRLPDAPDRASVKRAMNAVERRIVEAVWTLQRLPDREARFFGNGRTGLDYIQERGERFSNAVANGGKWDERAPRPSPPSSRAIDAMEEPLVWLQMLPPEQSKIVAIAAATKRGDVERNVSWNRVRDALPQCAGQTIRTLQRRYEGGIRTIVERLT